jgi:hypothetical protein
MVGRDDPQTLLGSDVWLVRIELEEPAAPPPEAASPSELSADLTLPEPLAARLAVPLHELGLKLETAERTDPFGSAPKTLTLARRADIEVVLLHLSPQLLSEPSNAGLTSMQSLETLFEDGERIALFSTGLDALPVAFQALLRQWNVDGRVRVSFVAWRRAEEIAAMDGPHGGEALRRILELPG